MIAAHHVTMRFPIPKRYADYFIAPFHQKYAEALSNISLEIAPGDRVAFLGINGAGKTTLLKLIGGLLYPSSGKIVVNGYDTTRHNRKARAEVGFVLNEERSFYWRLSGRQNLRFFGALDNLPPLQLDAKIKEMIGLVGLDSAADKAVATYSSGMKQRLAIARGLLNDPRILILDEPTRALDPEAVEAVKQLLLDKIHRDEQRTLLIATHRFDEAEVLCNQICVMRKGEVLAYQPTSAALSGGAGIAGFYEHCLNKDKHKNAYQEGR